jgi:hypothetical protein
MTDARNEKLRQIYPYPDEETRIRCLDRIALGLPNRLGETNRQLELYNLFLDDAIAQIDKELRQQKRFSRADAMRSRLLQKVKPAE